MTHIDIVAYLCLLWILLCQYLIADITAEIAMGLEHELGYLGAESRVDP